MPAHERADLAVQHGDRHVGREQRDPAVRRPAVVRHAAVPLPASACETRSDATGRPPSVPAALTASPATTPRTPSASRAEVARPCATTGDVGSDHEPGRQQRRVHRDRLVVAAPRLTDGEARGQPPRFAQPCDGRRERRRERAPVGHDVGDPRVRPVVAQARHDGGQGRVQVRDDDRHPAEVVGVGQRGVVRALLLVDPEDHRLQWGVARLDHVPRRALRPRRQRVVVAVGERDDEASPPVPRPRSSAVVLSRAVSPTTGSPVRSG